MARAFLSAALALVVCAGSLLAGEIRGKLKSVDAEKKTITITTKDGDKTLNCDKECKVLGPTNKELPAGLKAIRGSPQVIVTTKGEGESAVATQIRLSGRAAPRRDKN